MRQRFLCLPQGGSLNTRAKFATTCVVLLATLLISAVAIASAPVSPLGENGQNKPLGEQLRMDASKTLGAPVNFPAALAAGANYVRHAQSDVTEDNAGNGNPDVDLEDGGWDWVLTSPAFTHSAVASAPNLYGVTALGPYYAYLASPDAALFTAMTDAAVVLAGNSALRTSSDIIFLMNYADLSGVNRTLYMDAARAKFDARIAASGTATAFAQAMRDDRASYHNGIIGWDLGAWAVVAQMLDVRYPGNGYATAAVDIAEVLYQDSYMNNPGLFDIVDDAGFDPTYATRDYWWYNLGISGLIDAFRASGSHTEEIPVLVARLQASQTSEGAVCGSYGVHANDEAWQSTAYVAMTLATLNRTTYQPEINRMAYFLAATQDATSGAWLYSDNTHYPEIGGECTAAMSFGMAPSNVIVDDDFATQVAVDGYNSANSTHFVLGYDAFNNIQVAIDAVPAGGVVNINNGTYLQTTTLNVTKGITIVGQSESGVIINAGAVAGYGFILSAHDVILRNFTISPPDQNYPIHASGVTNLPNGYNNLTIRDVTVAGAHRRTGFDINGYNNVVLSHLTSGNAYGGNGLQISGCVGVTMNNITTTNNAWGSIAVYVSKPGQMNRGSQNVVIDGNTLNLGEGYLFMQDESGIFNTNISVLGYEYTVRNTSFREPNTDSAGYTIFKDTLAEATAFALSLTGHVHHSSIIEIATGEFVVVPGMSIQAAIDAAVPGNVIDVAAGDYTENILVNKRVSIMGAGSGSDPATATILRQNPAGAGDAAIGVIQLSASGISALDPILIKDMRVLPSAMAGISIGRHNESTGTTVAFVNLNNIKVIGTNLAPTTEQERGLYVDQTSTLTSLKVTDCAFDNLTYGWYFMKQVSAEPSTVRYVAVTGTTFNHNNLKGIYAEKLADASFTNCTATNNGFASDPAWATPWMCGIDINLKAGTYANLLFADCTITNNALGGAQHGVGMTVKGRGTGNDSSTYMAFPALVDNVLIQDCVVTGNERGIRCGEPGKDNTTPTNVVVTGGLIANNVKTYSGSDGSAYGGLVNVSTAQDDARGNWWGSASGPYNTPNNLGGLGNAVVGNVLFDPWRTGVIVPTPDPLDLNSAHPSGNIEVSYLGGAGNIYGYSIEVKWTNTVATATFSKPDSGPFAAGEVLFQTVPIPGGVRIDAALFGNRPGIPAGALFKMVATAAPGSDGTQTVLDLNAVYVNDYAQPPNTTVPADDGRIRVDVVAPVVAGVLTTDTTILSTNWVKNGDVVVITATVTDDATPLTVTCNLTGFGGGAAVAPTSIIGNAYSWSFTVVGCSPSNGSVSVAVTATDVLGNTANGSDNITADNIRPTPLTGVVALPGHQKIHVSWNNATGNDANYAGVAFRYDVRSPYNYPQYNLAAPSYPATHTAGTAAFAATGVATDWPVTTPRDIYFLAGFVYDLAGNYSITDITPTNRDAATNYWLGDVGPIDGEVDGLDVSVLGWCYGTLEGNGLFNPACDVGPTDDWTSFGVPTPDNEIGFFDLMIFAMNYGVVTPAGKAMTAGTTPALTWRQIDETNWALTLDGECAGLKGLNISAELPAGVTCQVQAGELLARQSAHFLKNIPEHGLDTGLAVLGQNVGIEGAGDLVVVTFSAPVANLDLVVQARDTANAELLVEMSGTTGVVIPTVFSLAQNFPNPFNPQTTINFALPRNEHVRLAVFSVNGARVRSLVDEAYTAGAHSVVWDGRDGAGRTVATGTYFYMIDAGDFHQVRKMVLMK